MTTAVLKIWAKRHRDLSRARNQVVCRMHAVLCDLVPGGVSKSINAGQAAVVLERVQPRGAVGAARWILAEQFLPDLRRTGVQRRDAKKKLAAAARASGTTVTEIFGVAPRWPPPCSATWATSPASPARTAPPPATAPPPVEVSSGNRVVHRLSLRGNRRMNHAVHMAAITQIATGTPRGAPTTTRRSPGARHRRRRCARSSGRSATPSASR